MAAYKLEYDEIKKHIHGHYEDGAWVSFDPTKELLKDLTDWVTQPEDYLYNSKKGKYEKNPFSPK